MINVNGYVISGNETNEELIRMLDSSEDLLIKLLVDRLVNSKDEITSREEELESTISDLEHSIWIKDDEISSLDYKIEKLQDNINDLESTIEDTTKEIKELNANIEDNNLELAKLNGQIALYEAEAYDASC